MQVEIRWNVRDPDSLRKSAAELLARSGCHRRYRQRGLGPLLRSAQKKDHPAETPGELPVNL